MIYNTGLLASMALFRQLYDDDSNILKVIEYFIIDVIKDKGISNFTLPVIADYVNQEYLFDIPEAIFRRCLKNLKKQSLITQFENNYIVMDKLKTQRQPNLESMTIEIQRDHNFIIESLFNFIESHLKRDIQDNEKPEIIKTFIDYFVNENGKSKYSDYVNAFIISLKGNIEYISKLSSIKEGIIIYSGIRFGIEDDSISRLNKTLTIFLDQEILFSLNNYNGEIYSRLSLEIVKYANEINAKTLQKKGKSFIELRFLEETRKLIKNFFSAAEYALRSDKFIEPDVVAMRYILNDCLTPSDINLKEIAFFKKLEDFGIIVEEKYPYYSKENIQYNSISTELCEKIGMDLGIDPTDTSFEIVNLISIRRMNHRSNNLFESKCILLTETGSKLRIARNESLLDSNFVPLTINTDYFVTNAWLLLNKGLGSNQHPTTFNVLTKAQITLSSRLSKSVREGYDDLKKKFDSGIISKEIATEAIIQLRNQPILPEQISEENVLDVIEGISNSEIITKQEMFDRLNIELRNKNKENELLLEERDNSRIKAQIEIENMNNYSKSLQQQLNDAVEKLKEISEKNRLIEAENFFRKNRRRNILKFSSLVILFSMLTWLSYTNVLVSGLISNIASLISILLGINYLVSLFKEIFIKKQ
jgi:hypothetical protein